MFDKSKMPPGLLKEIPGKANNTARMAKQNALQRRLNKTTSPEASKKLPVTNQGKPTVTQPAGKPAQTVQLPIRK